MRAKEKCTKRNERVNVNATEQSEKYIRNERYVHDVGKLCSASRYTRVEYILMFQLRGILFIFTVQCKLN